VLEALDAALAFGADMFEFDVRRAADGTLVVHHDETIDSVPLTTMPFAAAQCAARRCGYELPPLSAVLSRARGAIALDVELKESGYEAAVLDHLGGHGFDRERFVITSFEQKALDAIHARDAAVATGLLVYDMAGREAIHRFAQSGARFLGPDVAMLDDETLRRAMESQVALLPWTVNDAAAMRRLLVAGAVAGVITDDPRTALAIRAGADGVEHRPPAPSLW
jgi:glycerophosphoryl diester phosphodiesterase